MNMRKRIWLIIVIIAITVLAIFSLFSGGIIWIYQSIEKSVNIETAILNDLGNVDQNANIVFIGDNRIYFHDKTICEQDVSIKDARFIYVDETYIYLYTVNSQDSTVVLYRVDHSLSAYEQIFQNSYQKQAHNFQVKAPGIICFESTPDLFICYDTQTQILYHDLAPTDIESIMTNNSEYSVNITTESVTVTTNDNNYTVITAKQLKRTLMTKIDTEPNNFGILQAHTQGNNLYITCRTTPFSIVTCYKYDLNTDSLSLIGWRKIIDHEGTKMFVLNNIQ